MNRQAIAQALRDNPAMVQRGQEELQAILSRSTTDREFRSQLLDDPRAALSQYFDREVPESVNLYFVENHADATIVLPDPVTFGTELSDAELEAVAGGVAPLAIAGWIAVGFICTAIGDALK